MALFSNKQTALIQIIIIIILIMKIKYNPAEKEMLNPF